MIVPLSVVISLLSPIKAPVFSVPLTDAVGISTLFLIDVASLVASVETLLLPNKPPTLDVPLTFAETVQFSIVFGFP